MMFDDKFPVFVDQFVCLCEFGMLLHRGELGRFDLKVWRMHVCNGGSFLCDATNFSKPTGYQRLICLFILGFAVLLCLNENFKVLILNSGECISAPEVAFCDTASSD